MIAVMLASALLQALAPYKGDRLFVDTVEKIITLNENYLADKLDLIIVLQPYEDRVPSFNELIDLPEFLRLLEAHGLLEMVNIGYTRKSFHQVADKHFIYGNEYKLARISDIGLREVLGLLKDSPQETPAGLCVSLCDEENAGSIKVNNKSLVDLKNGSRRYLICSVVLSTRDHYKRWSWDEFVEAIGEDPVNIREWRMSIYRACRGVNEKMALAGNSEPLLIYDTKSFRLNPAYNVT